MLNCRACLWRCIRALDTLPSSSPRLRRHGTPSLVLAQQRFLHDQMTLDEVTARPANLPRLEGFPKPETEPWLESAEAVRQKKQEGLTLKRRSDEKNGSGEGTVAMSMWYGKPDPSMTQKERTARMKELQYLKDPLEVANFVGQELQKGKVKEMLQLVRMASHSMQCIVGWNHIIGHYLAKGKVSDALKVYNEMKKRAQFPDSYTYGILLRGLSANAHQSHALSKALSVYHSMFAPNARISPSVIHTNAILRVCARALDMDALWGIVSKIPESGRGAANSITYTTILNAIRQSLLVDVPKGENEEEVAARRECGVIEGRRIWDEIVGKWKKADLVMEEELVASMGRLLLIGSRPRDWDDVLSLVEQTMDVPRLVPRLGTPARYEAGLPHLRAPNTPEAYKFDDDHLSPDRNPTRGEEFLALTPQAAGWGTSTPLGYATPGNNTLSMLLEACQKIVAGKAAEEYWNMLTDPTTYNVVPDINNLHQRLRLLRQNRASGAAVKTLQDDFINKGLAPKPGTFRIAMSTCVRDKNNHNSLKHASRILHLMNSTLPDADSKAVAMFAELALSFPLAKGEDLVDALTILQPISKSIRLQLHVGAERKYGNGVGAVYLTGAERQDAIAALRKIYGVYDKLLLTNMIAEEKKAPFKAERARLSAFIQRIIFKQGGNRADESREGVNGEEGAKEEVPRKEEGVGKRRGGWRTRNVLPAEQRRPWLSSFGGIETT